MSIYRYNRREFLTIATACSATALCPFPLFAQTHSKNIFVWITLRGAMDGLNVAVPYGDKDYLALRPNIGLKKQQLLLLDDFFGLHPAMAQSHKWFKAGEFSVVQACSTPYRSRSHFDGQKVLENGTNDPFHTDGWLNRLIALDGSKNEGIAIDPGLPLIMQGGSKVASWYPNKLKTRDKQTELLAEMFQSDEMLSANFDSVMKVDGLVGDESVGKQFKSLMDKTGDILSANDAPNIAALELGGWDTHANQGAEKGRLANQLRALDTGLTSLRSSLGSSWNRTVIMVASEFGRTVAENGTKGTDHGTGNAMFIAGGAIKGGQVHTQWPGLSSSQLYQQRDLMPTTDMRSVIRSVLSNHLSLSREQLNEVFPGSDNLPPFILT